jgi:hypothetical protein
VALKFPPWLDLGILLIGIGTLLIFIGFLFGDAAVTQYGPGGSLSTYQGDMEAFFVLTGVGVLLTIGGWLFRVVMALRRGHLR